MQANHIYNVQTHVMKCVELFWIFAIVNLLGGSSTLEPNMYSLSSITQFDNSAASMPVCLTSLTSTLKQTYGTAWFKCSVGISSMCFHWPMGHRAVNRIIVMVCCRYPDNPGHAPTPAPSPHPPPHPPRRPRGTQWCHLALITLGIRTPQKWPWQPVLKVPFGPDGILQIAETEKKYNVALHAPTMPPKKHKST